MKNEMYLLNDILLIANLLFTFIYLIYLKYY